MAQALHQLSKRAGHPFVPINCAAIPEHLIESELFGHVKGAFTDAHDNRPGAFLEAGSGTLFLDEIGELSQGAQAKLLRVLETKKVRPVGGTGTRDVKCRVVTATHRDLDARVQANQFRLDFMYRISALRIALPPLRERVDDVALLAEHLLREGEFKDTTLSPGALRKLEAHPWPGNVRELSHVLRRAAARHRKKELKAADLELQTVSGGRNDGMKHYVRGLSLDKHVVNVVREALEVHGTMEATAAELEIGRNRLRNHLRKSPEEEPETE